MDDAQPTPSEQPNPPEQPEQPNPPEQPTASEQPEPEDVQSEWFDLFFRDDAPDVRWDLFREATADLSRFLSAHPDAEDRVLPMLERRLGGRLDRDAWPKVTASLTTYLGEQPTYLLNWLAYLNTAKRLDALDGRVEPAVLDFLRSVLAQFGAELDASQTLTVTAPNDWARIDKHVNFDLLENTYRFSISLTKNNGEVVSLDSTPDSLINLSRHLMVMLASVGRADVFSPERVQGFLDQAIPVVQMLMPQEDPAGAQAAATGGEASPAGNGDGRSSG
jgi:hypothetical protein